MSLKIQSEKKNAIFKRTEVVATVHQDITPSKIEAAQVIATHFKASPEEVQVNAIEGAFGTHTFTILAHVYESVKDKDRTVVKTRKAKKELRKQANAKKPEAAA